MADSQRRPILGNGEEYSRAVKKRPLGRAAEPPRTYEEARELVKVGVRNALASFETLPAEKKLVNEAKKEILEVVVDGSISVIVVVRVDKACHHHWCWSG